MVLIIGNIIALIGSILMIYAGVIKDKKRNITCSIFTSRIIRN